MEAFTVQPGFRVELVASEPLIHDPVAIDFDEGGRIWVAEMRSYMPNIDGEGELEPTGRIVVLKDTNGDGRMDQSTVFWDGLILPRSIRVVAGGVLVGEPPNLWFARDTNGDGRMDEKTVVTDDYSHREANPELGGNGLLIGLDNWIENAMYSGGSFRFRNGEWVNRPALRRGQWGISMDDFGRYFTNSNSDYLRADLVSYHYFARNEHFPRGRRGIPGQSSGVYWRVDSNQETWPSRITPGVNRRVHLRDDGTLARFTAACAPLVYRGTNFPESYRGDVFVAEPAAHFIRRAILEEDANGVITGRNAYDRDEFLSSSDERFRPVNLYNGPSGGLYVVDMYRGVLQHRQFVTTYLRKQVEERGLEEPVALGRIYRVVHDEGPLDSAPRMSASPVEELAGFLAHENGWWRDTAQRVLIERGDLTVAPRLREMAMGDNNSLARIHAYWTLEGLGETTPEFLIEAISDPAPHGRAQVLRVAEEWLRDDREAIWPVFERGLADESGIVRRQAALSLGGIRGEEVEEAYARLLAESPDLPFLAESVLSGLEGRELEFLERMLERADWQVERDGSRGLPQLFAAAVMNEGIGERIDRLFVLAGRDEFPEWARLAILEGVERSRVRSLPVRPDGLAQLALSGSERIRAAAMELAENLEWPAGGEEEPPELLSPEAQERLAQGRRYYEMTCAACHQPDGSGMEGLAPALAGSEWVTGDRKSLIKVLLHGKESAEWAMPPFGALDDETLAAIVSYLRQSWGHQRSIIDAGDVRVVREATAGRRGPVTEADLGSSQE